VNVYELEETLGRLADELVQRPRSRRRARQITALALVQIGVWVRHAHDHLPHDEEAMRVHTGTQDD